MHKGAYEFQVDRSQPLAAEAERAVNRIYGAGLMFRGAVLGAGGNNVMADAAAKAFSEKDLFNLRQAGGQAAKMAAVIETRRDYADLPGAARSLDGTNMLQKIYDIAQDLKKGGWTPESEPARVGYTPLTPKP